jgi:hypothetical protein
MLLIFIDLLIAFAVVLAVVYVFQNMLKQHKQAKIDAALQRQKDAEHMAKIVADLNPEKVKQNEAKVEDTLNKLQ